MMCVIGPLWQSEKQEDMILIARWEKYDRIEAIRMFSTIDGF